MRTQHMKSRILKRGFSEDKIRMIEALGEWNERTDRLVLTQQVIEQRQLQVRTEIAALEEQIR